MGNVLPLPPGYDPERGKAIRRRTAKPRTEVLRGPLPAVSTTTFDALVAGKLTLRMSEVARLLGVHHATALAHRRELGATRMGGIYLVPVDRLRAWLFGSSGDIGTGRGA